MQAVAEEKKKAYRCVVWSEKAISSEQLHTLYDLTDLQTGKYLEVGKRRLAE
jgi:hypothetical protein